MKKLLSVFLSVLFLLTALPLGAVNVAAATSGNLTYTIKDGAVTITDCNTSASGVLTIPSTIEGYPVTAIGENAFYYCGSLTSVTIPDSVTSIGEWAFHYCRSLTSVTIPDSVTSIGDYAFYYCDKLTSITVSAANPNYTSVDGVLFNKDKTALIMAPGAISGEYIIPDSVTIIGDYAFHYCRSLTTVTIPDSVTSIGDYAFYYCGSLTSVTIGNGVTTIGDYAFYYCGSLTSVTIPDSVTSIGERAFSSCDKLTSITVSAANPNYTSVDGVLFNKDKTALIMALDGISGEYTIPDSVTTIGDYAFNSCDSLTTVIIPDSVTTIGLGAFADCRSLTSITIPDSVTTIGIAAFFHCALTSITIPDSVTTIGNEAFMSCESLTSVTIGNGVTTIGDFAFECCYSLASITIPDSVITIGGNAFYDCPSLTSVTIGKGVTTIGYLAFSSCDSLTSVTIPDSVAYIGYGAFESCSSLSDVYYSGTEEDKANIAIDEGNDPLRNATWHYHEHTYDDEHDADCNECGKIRCIHEYFSACDIVCLICNEVGREASHNIVHVPAVANTCYEEGNIEYWYCTECGYAWLDEECTLNTNLLSVILPAAHSDDHSYDPYDCSNHRYRCTLCGEVVLSYYVQHFPAVAPTHFTEGNVEYWYCTICWTYFLNEDCTEMVEYRALTILPPSHDIVHVEAKAPTCTELGNIEHWYCTECGYAWLDEDCTLNTNLKAVILPMAEHTYDHAYDTDCNECGEVREMDSPIAYLGASTSEDVSGLAMLFRADAEGITVKAGTVKQADYTNATHKDFKLLGLGVVATNGLDTVTIKGERLYAPEEDITCFAFRIIDIPTDRRDVAITMTPYYAIEIDGVETVVYGESQTKTYNEANS